MPANVGQVTRVLLLLPVHVLKKWKSLNLTRTLLLTVLPLYNSRIQPVPTVSLLDHHNCAEWSSLARKHKLKPNPAPVEAKRDNDTHQRQHYYTDSSTTMIAILSISLLDHLKCAQRSSLARKRKVKTNLDPVEARNGQWHLPATTLLYWQFYNYDRHTFYKLIRWPQVRTALKVGKET